MDFDSKSTLYIYSRNTSTDLYNFLVTLYRSGGRKKIGKINRPHLTQKIIFPTIVLPVLNTVVEPTRLFYPLCSFSFGPRGH